MHQVLLQNRQVPVRAFFLHAHRLHPPGQETPDYPKLHLSLPVCGRQELIRLDQHIQILPLLFLKLQKTLPVLFQAVLVLLPLLVQGLSQNFLLLLSVPRLLIHSLPSAVLLLLPFSEVLLISSLPPLDRLSVPLLTALLPVLLPLP